MEFRQPANVNHLVSADVPLTWEVRRRSIRRLWPIVLFSSLCMAETTAVKLMEAGRTWREGLPLLAVAFFFPVVLLLVSMEVAARMTATSARWVRLDEKGIVRSPAKRRRVAWKNLESISISSVPSDVTLAKVMFEVRGAPNWPIVLRTTEDVPAVVAEVKRRGVCVLEKPAASAADTADAERKFKRMMGVSFLGLYLLVHGLPLLFVGLSRREESREARTSERVSPAMKSFVRSFESSESMRRFFLGSGLALSAAGFTLFILGRRRSDGKAV